MTTMSLAPQWLTILKVAERAELEGLEKESAVVQWKRWLTGLVESVVVDGSVGRPLVWRKRRSLTEAIVVEMFKITYMIIYMF